MKIRSIKIIFILLMLSAAMYAYSVIKYKENISGELPVKETIDLIDEIKKEINNPPPLKNLNGGVITSNLSTAGIMKWTNESRRENGNLSALAEDEALDTFAQKRLEDMFQNQYFEHISPSGSGISDIARENGYEYITIGENIALGNFKDDEALVKAWMDSPGHRANILKGKYSNMGIAVLHGEYENKKTWMAIQVFSLPLSACARVDKSLKQKIDINKQMIGKLENSADSLRLELESSKYPDSGQKIFLYNEKIKTYNSLIANLNDLIDETKRQVSQYNKQVDAFNKCASGE